MMDIFLTHGAPEVILTDRGREFWNNVVNEEMFRMCGIKHCMSSAYHPQTNDERTNQTLKVAIGKSLHGHQERWEEHLKAIVFANNTSIQCSSRFTPFRLMYGQEPRLFTEVLPNAISFHATLKDIGYVVIILHLEIKLFFTQVLVNLEKAQKRQKDAYQHRTKKRTKRFLIKPGMVVLKKDERKRGRPGMAMKPDWPTTYRVIGVEGNLVQLETMDGVPLKSRTPYASVKPLRTSLSGPLQLSHLLIAMCGLTYFYLSQVTCTVPPSALSSQRETGQMPGSTTEEETLENSDIVVSGVQLGQPVVASLSDRVEEIRAMVLQPYTWLDDHAIDHAMALLRAQYPHIGGLLSTTSLGLLTHVPPPSTQWFVQIINISGNHWVAVSTLGCQVGYVNVYDSLHQTYTEDFAAQVTSLFCFAGNTVRLQWPDVQQQKGASDCGLFAIANSLTLCRGEDPRNVQYHQGYMRAHLCSSLQAGVLTPFPSMVRSASAVPLHIREVEVHCYCRRSMRAGKEDVVTCGRCGKVFHQDCIAPHDGPVYICYSCTVIRSL
ncbi:hypothetical protein ACEWY4_007519 [Coilia grayii]|uniref:Integrase catalytic domain-containing protein n=1 Tax=Coilia grayii TaxID=363190 RepID=A0ABD1KGW4_9TELE